MSDNIVLRGARIVEPGVGVGPATTVAIESDRIAATGDAAGNAAGHVVDVDGLWLVPGLIDLQVNGAAGRDTTDDPGSIWAVGEALAATGVTAFLPTIVTAPAGRIEEALRVVATGPPAGYRGAAVLGLHLEGPFLSPRRHGAHDPALLRDPDLDLTAGWTADAGVVMVTIAPELTGAPELIRALTARGIVVSIGHEARQQADARCRAGRLDVHEDVG